MASGQGTDALGFSKHPAGRSCASPFCGRGSPIGVMPPDTGSVILEALAMASAPALHAMQTRTARDLYAGAAVAALTFAASIVVMLHGGYSVSHAGPGTLDTAGIALVALSTL